MRINKIFGFFRLYFAFIFIVFSIFLAPALFAHSLKKSVDYRFLVITDTHVGVQHKMELAPEGRNHLNDLDDKTFAMLLKDARTLIDTHKISPQSIIVLGDLVNHADGSISSGSYAGRRRQLHLNFTQLAQQFGSLPVIYVFGNNDSLSGDYKSFSSTVGAEHTPWEVALHSGWKGGYLSTGKQCTTKNPAYPCIVPRTQDTKNGLSVIRLAPHLRLISLNTVLYNRSFSGTYHGDHYNGEPEWFNRQLQDAKKNDDSVLIAMHIPPGYNLHEKKLFWESQAQNDFLKSLNAFDDTVAGILAAHTHMDELRVFLAEHHRSIPVIVSPGLSTSHGNAPAMKYFIIRSDNENKHWNMQNFTTFFYTDKHFEKLYDFQSYYCSALRRSFAGDCLAWYAENDRLPHLLALMNRYYTAGNPNNRNGMPDADPNHLVM